MLKPVCTNYWIILCEKHNFSGEVFVSSDNTEIQWIKPKLSPSVSPKEAEEKVAIKFHLTPLSIVLQLFWDEQK